MKKMNPNPLSAAARVFALLPAFILLGCLGSSDNVRVAGGDDIPNDVEPLGKKSAQARNDSTDWNGFKTMPRTSPGMYDTTTVPDSIPDTTGSGKAQPKAAAKTAANRGSGSGVGDEAGIPPLPGPLDPLDTLITKVVDTVKGTVEAVHTTVKDSILKVDSTVFVPADSTKPGSPKGVLQVSGKITQADTSLWRSYRFRDADGDGFLAPRPGSLNLADLDVSVKGAGGLITHTAQRVAAGADLDFNGHGDNKVLASLMTVTLGADTLDVIKLLDADGDSVVLDFAKDTNLVDLIEEHHYPAGSAQASLSLKVRLVVFSKDSTRNYAVRYQSTLRNRDGSILEITTRGAAADSSFRAGTDAMWTETLTRPTGDSIVSHARAFTVRLAPTPGAFQGNTLSDVAVTETYSATVFSRFTFDLRPEVPVADGKWPATGAVKAALDYRAGGAITFEGQAVAGGMEGSVTTSAGAVVSIFFDRNGAATRRP